MSCWRPIAAHWQPRVRKGGTYDRTWQRNRAPLPPLDLDPAFHNVAPEDQQLAYYLPGEEVRLVYMTRNGRDRFLLPALDVPVLIATDDALVEGPALVDTILIEPEELRFSLIARATCPMATTATVAHEVVVGTPSAGHRRALETGKRYRMSPGSTLRL